MQKPGKRVGIFWDVENCSIPVGMPGDIVVDRIRSAVKHFGELAEFNAYGDIRLEGIAKNRRGLQSSGVCIIDTPHHSKKQVADMRIIADIIAFALSHSEPVTVILISSDGDFTHAISIIQDNGHAAWIISSSLNTSGKLYCRADGMLSWKYDVLERTTSVTEPTNITDCIDGESGLEERENVCRITRAVSCNANAFVGGFGQTPFLHGQPVSSCQTSSYSFCASVRPLAIQTCFSPDGQNTLFPSCGPASVITSGPATGSADTFLVSSSSVSSHPHPREWQFFPLIKVLRELRACDSTKLKRHEIIQILLKRDPCIFAKYKRPRVYLCEAKAAGVIYMRRETKGEPMLVSLHPDYY